MCIKKIAVMGIVIMMTIGLCSCGRGTEVTIKEDAEVQELVQKEEREAKEKVKEEKKVDNEDTNATHAKEISNPVEEKTDDNWKQAYRDVVKKWDIMHAKDYEYGYELAYIDDNDVPELILFCDDEAWCAMDMYTYIDGKAVRMEIFDMEGNKAERSSTYLSPGCQKKEDFYIEKGNVYFQTGGTTGSDNTMGYMMNGNCLYQMIDYSCINNYWDETSDDPVHYTLEYTNSNKNNVSVRNSVKEEESGYEDIKNIPEAKDLEQEYNFTFKNRRGLGGEGKMDFAGMCKALDMDTNYEMTANEIYASLLLQYMYDETLMLIDGLECYSYLNGGGKFMLKDVNGDGVDEMLVTLYETECTLFIPKKTWQEAQICNFNQYGDGGILKYENGDLACTMSYQRFDGSSLSFVDQYELEEWDTEEFGGTHCYHVDEAGNRTDISYEQYDASRSLYGVHKVTGEWHEINNNEIKTYLLELLDE